MKLQLALDVLSIEKALEICSLASDYVDIIEAGTPFIKAEGLRCVSALRSKFQEKEIVADTKTMDVGFLEAKMAFDAGAHIMSVLASAPDSTIKEAVRAGSEFGIKVMGDLIGVLDAEKRAKEIADMGVDYILVHTGIDEQNEGCDPLLRLEKVASSVSTKIAVAGGLNPQKIAQIRERGIRTDIAIVGGFITSAQDPKEAARKVKEAFE